MKQTLRTIALASIVGLVAASASAQTQGVTDDEIVLGTTIDLTGPVAAIGVPMRAGFEVAVDVINDAGGINGRKLRIVVEDNGYDTRRAIQGVQKLINSDQVFGLVGILGSAITLATQPIIHDAGLPNLFPAAPTPLVYEPPHRLSFALLTGYDLQMREATKYAHDELGKRRFCILYQDDESGEQALHGVQQQLEEYGLSLVERTSYTRGATDFSAQIARLRAADCDAVMLGTIVRETAGAAIERTRIGWDVPMFVNNAGVSNAVIALGGDAVEGLYGFASLLPMSLILDDDAEAAKAVARHKAKTGSDRNPDDYFFVAYSAVKLFAEGARNAGQDLTVDSFVEGMEKVEDLHAPAFGPMSFGSDRRLGSEAITPVQVQGGQWVRVN